MFYSYFNSETGMRPAYGILSITYSGAQSTVQAIQQALQMQQQLQNAAARCTNVLFIRRVFYPVHQVTPYGSSFRLFHMGLYTTYN